MELFIATTFFGLYIGSAYAIAASGLVLTYTTTRVFNLAHGAMSMGMAFLYWELHVNRGLGTLTSVLLVVFVAAPLFGLILQAVMGKLGDAPVSVSLVVTVALFMALIGAATQFWPADVLRSVDFFFGYEAMDIFGARIGYHYIMTIAVSGVVALLLYLLLNRTRMGIAMRAAVDNPELLELFGAETRWVATASWMLGSMLAALGGVLLAAYTGLDYYSLTFLVIAAFAAAMLGQLKSLPLTYLGAMLLGLGASYIQNYLPVSAHIQLGLQSSLPTFLLFMVLLLVPQVRLRVGQVKGIKAARVASPRQTVAGAALLIFGTLVALSLLDGPQVQDFGLAVVYGIVMLSMVLLVGYGGYVSLAQFSFVGIGAATVAKVPSDSPWVILLAVVIATAVGALVALPVLRLTGLYLALATLAFGQLMDKLVFNADYVFGQNGSLLVERVKIFGYDFEDDADYVLLLVGVFLLVGATVLWLRRGPVGRLLIALRDSPAASGTLGLNRRWFRVALFSASSGIAGLAGALMAGLQGLASPLSFSTIASLPTVLVAVVAGVTTVSGAFVGGILLMVTLTTTGGPQGMIFIVLAVGATLLARDPNGLVNLGYTGLRWLIRSAPVPVPDFLRAWASERVAVVPHASDEVGTEGAAGVEPEPALVTVGGEGSGHGAA
jgi:branched-chain amino acid transport system permease protein